jgi:hypothetical protein
MAHQHGHQGGDNTPAHRHDCGGRSGCGDEKGVEVVREDARWGRKGVKPPRGAAFAILTGIKANRRFRGRARSLAAGFVPWMRITRHLNLKRVDGGMGAAQQRS